MAAFAPACGRQVPRSLPLVKPRRNVRDLGLEGHSRNLRNIQQLPTLKDENALLPVIQRFSWMKI